MAEQRCAVDAVLGAPNAGKSTLVNTLVGAKVAAVTQKVQTTRALVRGIAMRDEVQRVLIDTPGVFSPKRRLDRAMVAAARSALEGADAIVHVVDAAAHISGAKGADAQAVAYSAAIAKKLKEMELASILVLNKVDAVARPALLEITIEGELDDISGAGQTRAAHDLCTGVPKQRHFHYHVQGAGHYGIFSGRRWREKVYPEVRGFIYRFSSETMNLAPAASTKKARA